MEPTGASNHPLLAADMSRRQVLGLGALGVGALGLFALGGCSNGNASGGTSGAPKGSGAAAGGVTDFDFVSWSMSEEAPAVALKKAVDTFAADKSIKITTSSYPYNDYLNQVLLQINGGQFHGAAQLDIAWLSTLAATGKLADLSSYAQGVDYTNASLLTGQVEGKQLGLPWTNAAIGLIAHQGNLDAAGMKAMPGTIAEFEETLRALKALGNGMIPYAGSTKVAQLKDVIVWMMTFGCPIVENGKCTIGDEASVAAMTWYKKLFDDGLIAADVDRNAARSLFAQGKVGFYDDAPAGLATVLSNSPDPDLEAKMIPLPRPVQATGDTPQALAWGHLIVVVDGDGASGAANFGKWLTSDPTQAVAYFDALALPPTTDSALASQSVKKNAFISTFTEKVTKTSSPSPFWVYPQYGQMETDVAEQVQSALIGQSSPSDAMKAAGAAVQKLMG